MKNIPSIGNKLPVPANLISTVEKIASSAEKASLSPTEASIISLPKTKSSVNDSQGVETALNSFLSELSSGDKKNLAAAHSGLDASRVAELLGDD